MTDETDAAAAFAEGPGVAARHDTPLRLPLLVAPTDADRHNTIRVRPVPIACARLNRTGFDFDSSLVTPAIVPTMQQLGAAIDAHPDAPLAVFGHADPVGDDAYNKRLAGRRAEAVYALLTRDVARWESLYAQPVGGDDWRTHASRRMLAHLHGTAPAELAGWAPHDAAVRAFQAASGLAVDGVVGPQTRRALFSAYMDAICVRADFTPYSATPAQFLGQGEDPGGKAAFQGCGEFNPVFLFAAAEAAAPATGAAKDERDALNGVNRRVLVFLFRPGTTIAAASWPCPRASEGDAGCRAQFWPDGEQRRRPGEQRREYRRSRDTLACRFYDAFARRSPCEGIAATSVAITLYDDALQPARGAFYRATIESDVRVGQAPDATVLLRRVVIPSTCVIEWNLPPGPKLTRAGGEARFRMEVFLDVDAGGDDTAAARRLHNIGYAHSNPLPDNVRAFQRDEGLEVTGELDDATRTRLDEVHRLLAGSDGAGA